MARYTIAIGIPTAGSHRHEIATFREEAMVYCANHPQLELLRIPIRQVPAPVARNRLVKVCQERHVDVLFMVDDDMAPPPEFFRAAIKFLLNHKGPVAIGVPYCSGPPREDVMVFEWASGQSGTAETPWCVTNIVREDAARRTGIEAVPNLGTGCIAYKLSCFEALDRPYFNYSYNEDMTEVTETEDCFLHRRLNFAGIPLFVSWNHWAVHHKQKAVGRPVPVGTPEVLERFLKEHQAAKRHAEREEVAKGTPPFNGKPHTLTGKPGTATDLPEADYATACTSVLPEGDRPPVTDRLRPMAPVDAARWAQGVEGWMHPEELLWLAQRAAELQPGDAWVEVGSWKGRSASAVCLSLGPRTNLYCVDTWDGRGEVQAAGVDSSTSKADFDAVMERIVWKEPGRGCDVFSVPLESVKAAKGFTDGVDVVFIDAAHDYDAVKADLEAWLPKLKPGGLLAGHDRNEDGVHRAVVDVLRPRGLGTKNGPGTLWWCRVAVPDAVPKESPAEPPVEAKATQESIP
jgi:predicted O-methyltransferase YrrM